MAKKIKKELFHYEPLQGINIEGIADAAESFIYLENTNGGEIPEEKEIEHYIFEAIYRLIITNGGEIENKYLDEIYVKFNLLLADIIKIKAKHEELVIYHEKRMLIERNSKNKKKEYPKYMRAL